MSLYQPGMTIAEVEEVVIKQALSFYANNQFQTATSLAISPRTLYNKMKEYGMKEAVEPVEVKDESKGTKSNKHR